MKCVKLAETSAKTMSNGVSKEIVCADNMKL
jgi:hypothetical protein